MTERLEIHSKSIESKTITNPRSPIWDRPPMTMESARREWWPLRPCKLMKKMVFGVWTRPGDSLCTTPSLEVVVANGGGEYRYMVSTRPRRRHRFAPVAAVAIIAGSPTTSFSSVPITTTTRRRYSTTWQHRLLSSSSKSSEFDSPIVNYHDILGADSTMSRAKIRQRSIALARTTHIDSCSDDTTSNNNNNNSNSFDDVARAWEILSNTQSWIFQCFCQGNAWQYYP